jgi:Polyketide cyclase / dehydrase and lipid transport
MAMGGGKELAMKRVLKIIFGALALAIVAVLALAATKPDDFKIERTAVIKAPADKIFPLLNSPKAAMAWIPFMEPDPNVKLGFTGPESGVGAAQTWSGNSEVGEGKIEIIESKPPSEVKLKLDMAKPMEGHNTVVYKLEPKGAETAITWTMSGQQPFLGKVVSVLIDCDKMVGAQFEKGLGKLKSVAEAAK